MKKIFALFIGEIVLYKSYNYRELVKMRIELNKRNINAYTGTWIGRTNINFCEHKYGGNVCAKCADFPLI